MIAMVSEKSHNDKTQDKQTENMTPNNMCHAQTNPLKSCWAITQRNSEMSCCLPTTEAFSTTEWNTWMATSQLCCITSGICCLLFVGEKLLVAISWKLLHRYTEAWRTCRGRSRINPIQMSPKYRKSNWLKKASPFTYVFILGSHHASVTTLVSLSSFRLYITDCHGYRISYRPSTSERAVLSDFPSPTILLRGHNSQLFFLLYTK